jgi:hypothetical protein
MNVRAGNIVSVNLVAGRLCLLLFFVWFVVFVWEGGDVELFLYVIVWPVGVVCSPSKIVEVLGTCRRVNRKMTPYGNAAEAACVMRRVAHKCSITHVL